MMEMSWYHLLMGGGVAVANHESVGQRLKRYRLDAGLTQKQLADRVHLDASMISRLEKGRAKLKAPTLQDILNVLALHGIPRESLDDVWEASGFYRNRIDAPVADPVVAYIQQEFEKMDPELREVLSDDLRSATEIDQAYFSCSRDISQRRWDQAGQALLSLRRLLEEQRFQRWYLRIDEDIGWCLYSTGRYTEATQYYQSALWSARMLGDLPRQAGILIGLGDTHRRIGGQGWAKARQLYRSAGSMLGDKLGDQRGVVDCLRKTGGAYLFQGEPTKATPLLEESLWISKTLDYPEGIYRGLQHQSWAFDLVGRWNEATALCEDALARVESAEPHNWELAKAYRYLADAYRLQGRANEAKDAYEHALALLQRTENREGVHAKLLIGRIELGLAKVHLRIPGGEMKARTSLNRALEIHLSLGEDFAIAEVLGEQGELLLRLGRLQESEVRLRMAREHLKRLGNIFHYANVLATLCALYYKKGTDFSGQLYETAEEAREADNGLIDCHLARVELAVGKAHMDEKVYRHAFAAFAKASEKALDFNEQTFREVCESISAEVDRALQTLGPELGARLCESQIHFWQERLDALTGSARQLVVQWLDTMRLRQGELEALKPIQ
jgi:transcriptional regulator with XRE-family HTH domain